MQALKVLQPGLDFHQSSESHFDQESASPSATEGGDAELYDFAVQAWLRPGAAILQIVEH